MGPLPPFVVIEIAQKIGPATLTEVVRRHARHSNHKRDRAGNHSQPGLVHVSLRVTPQRFRASRVVGHSTVVVAVADGVFQHAVDIYADRVAVGGREK